MFEQIEVLEIIVLVLAVLVGFATFFVLQNRANSDDHLLDTYLHERDMMLHKIYSKSANDEVEFGEYESSVPSFREWKQKHDL
ncbi:hypothetical protein [Parasphingorhabdus sp.]|uniref:hypothetical protein n=1 Tax=Parasphingorhabdus sp. TaxID=2709688 RepID=UPI003A928077